MDLKAGKVFWDKLYKDHKIYPSLKKDKTCDVCRQYNCQYRAFAKSLTPL
ncbi:hypothetical protein ACFWDG_21795 [Peribacillus sp. NPDC060186]